MLGIGLGLTSRGVLGGGVPSWVLSGSSLDLYFSQNKFYGGAVLNVSRASSGYAEDNAGVWTLFGNNVARRTDKGLLVEESRTNSIRNNSMQGAAAGSPGTLPTNWVAGATGLTQTVVGTGTQNGIEYIDIRWAGTTGDTSGFYAFESGTAIAASAAQTWTQSVFLAVVGGSTANITSIQLNPRSNTAAGANVANNLGSNFKGSLSSSLARITHSPSLGGGGTVACVQPFINFTWASSAAIDITLRIGWPQLELGAFATSPIRTTSAESTRAADVVSLGLGPWFNAGSGTIYGAFNIPQSSGVSRLLTLDDGTTNNRIQIYRSSSSISNLAFAGGVTQADLYAGEGNAAVPHKDAFAYSLNDFAASLDAAAVATDATGTVPIVTTLRIGSQSSGGFANGYISRVAYFNSRLPNATLQSITQ